MVVVVVVVVVVAVVVVVVVVVVLLVLLLLLLLLVAAARCCCSLLLLAAAGAVDAAVTLAVVVSCLLTNLTCQTGTAFKPDPAVGLFGGLFFVWFAEAVVTGEYPLCTPHADLVKGIISVPPTPQ